jgi:hypothetical protein
MEKEVLWSKRCKDPSLVGTVKGTVLQVSSSKKWLSKPALDDAGNQILQKNGKPVLRKSYSALQDDFFRFMRSAGYDDVERGERGLLRGTAWREEWCELLISKLWPIPEHDEHSVEIRRREIKRSLTMRTDTREIEIDEPISWTR